MKEKVHVFGNITLEKGFTGKSKSVDDDSPGAMVTYMWQWMQVKVYIYHITYIGVHCIQMTYILLD